MPNAMRILVPIDFDGSEAEVIQRALQLARIGNAEVIVLHVETGLVPIYDEELGILEPNRMMNLLRIRTLKQGLSQVEFRTLVLYGDPAKVILQTAADEKVDLVVMGTHGRSGLDRVLLGSVAETILRKASCPVMLVKSAKQNDREADDAGGASVPSRAHQQQSRA